jgi:hypothetical protein
MTSNDEIVALLRAMAEDLSTIADEARSSRLLLDEIYQSVSSLESDLGDIDRDGVKVRR